MGRRSHGGLGDMLQAALPNAVRGRLEKPMRTRRNEYQSDFARKYFARGEEVPAAAAGRIEAERDDARLDMLNSSRGDGDHDR